MSADRSIGYRNFAIDNNTYILFEFININRSTSEALVVIIQIQNFINFGSITLCIVYYWLIQSIFVSSYS